MDDVGDGLDEDGGRGHDELSSGEAGLTSTATARDMPGSCSTAESGGDGMSI